MLNKRIISPLKKFRHCKYCTKSDWQYDVIVVGGGHAGCESAVASAKLAKTLLITHSKEKIGEMSCNPSFGGIGKGHLMREIDAMDGISPRICDQTGIHFHILNSTRGPAVIGLRALIDRKLYRKAMQQEILHNTPNLDVIESTVEDICFAERTSSIKEEDERTHQVTGCILVDGRRISSPTLVLTTGTFLNGTLHWGQKQMNGGRIGEASCSGLTRTFNRLGFKTGRLSTGTPPRLLSKTIDYSKFEAQPTDAEPIPFSFLNESIGIQTSQHVNCYLGYTNDRVIEIVRENISEEHTLMKQWNEGIKGPRYCPSLEIKCLRFGHLKHRLFLEPESLDSDLIYPQGCSLSFNLDVQKKIMRAIDGLENVQIAQQGYQVRYNFVHPQQLHESLETRRAIGLFLAGQINGTTGYEEAAAQGLIAGSNAAIRSKATQKGESTYQPLIVGRSHGYIGVMIDDLTTFGVTEPYRMFTSRAENRLHLRPDNADLRLTAKARKFGIISDKRWEHFQRMLSRMQVLNERLESLKFTSAGWNEQIPGLNTPGKGDNLYNTKKLMTKHPELSVKNLAQKWPTLFEEFAGDRHLENRIRGQELYAKYAKQLEEQMERLQREMNAQLPDSLDYMTMKAPISPEMRERLQEYRPRSLAAAARIPGINDTILYHLLIYAKKRIDVEMVNGMN